MTQTTLWLLPLLLGSVFGIINGLKLGWRWSAGTIAQHSIVLLLSVLGLFIFPKYDSIFAVLGWCFLLSYTVIARMLVMKMGQALGLLRCSEAIKAARILSFLVWGRPAKFWLEICYMVNFYVQGDIASGEAVYQKWRAEDLPRVSSDMLNSYAMIGLLLTRDWEKVIEMYRVARADFEKDKAKKKKDLRFSVQLAVPAIRAFSELGRFRELRDAMALSDLSSSSLGRDSIDTVFMGIFAQLGARQELEEVLASMSGSKTALPEHVRLYWQGRCLHACKQEEAALLSLAESLRKTPAKDSAWRERTHFQMQLVQDCLKSKSSVAEAEQAQPQQAYLEEAQPQEAPSETLAFDGSDLAEKNGDESEESERLLAIAEAVEARKRCLLVSEILSSRKSPLATRVMTGLITVSFILCFSPYLLNDRSFLQISNFAFTYGVLDGRLVFEGQWWRLISYQFLHGGLSHLFMNIFALIWFGRFVEGVFGRMRFLIIYIGSGILSGLAQILIDPSGQAVGASGAILGVFGAGFAATLRLKGVLPNQVRRHELSWMIALAVTQLLFDQLVNLLFPSKEGQEAIKIAAAAHFGGMLSGFLLGWLLPMPKLGTEELESGQAQKP